MSYFEFDGVNGKILKSFSVELNELATANDPYCTHFCMQAEYYRISAEFED